MFLDRLRQLTPPREQKATAGRAGISEQTFCRWMSGKLPPNPTLATLEKLARAYRKPVAYLISDGDEPTAEAVSVSVDSEAKKKADDALEEVLDAWKAVRAKGRR